MGGAASEVSEETHNVIVESAIFDPVSIRRTAFRTALRSEASLRFEKGQESRLARVGARRRGRLQRVVRRRVAVDGERAHVRQLRQAQVLGHLDRE